MSEYTILSIDDDPSTRVLFEMMLSRAGFDVVQAEDADEAVQKLQEIEPDLIMTDLDMPVMTGIEMLRQLRRTDLVTPVVVMTSRESADSRKEALDSGANAYLVKSRDAAQSLRQAFNLLLDTRDGRAA